MKKLQQRLVALAMAGVMLVGHMYAYTAAQDTATETAPTIGSHVNLVNLEDTPFLSAGTNYGPEDLSQTVQGDTWYLSATVNFSKVAAWNGPELALASGTVTQTAADGTATAADDRMIRLQIRNTDTGVGQYILNWAAEPMYTPGNTLLAGEVGLSFEAEKDYRVTIAVSGRDKLSLWLDDIKLLDGRSLAGLGITNLQPGIGWRCYSSVGMLKRLQVWDEVTERPVFDETTDRNAALFSELSLETPDGYAERPLESVRYGSRYVFSGRVNAEIRR